MEQFPDGPFKMTCIVCDQSVNAHIYDGRPAVADDAVICEGHGNYGSRVLDLDNCFITFVVCDGCIVKKRNFLTALHCNTPRRQYYVAESPIPSELTRAQGIEESNAQSGNPLP